MRAGGLGCAAALVAVLAGCGPVAPAGGGRERQPPQPEASAAGAAGGGDAAVRGRVMRVQGAPGAHCLLRARAPSRPVPDPETAAVTDARGRYAWSLPAATYTLWARCGAAEGRVEGVEAVAGRTVRADIVVE